MSTAKSVSQAYECSLPENYAQASFSSLLLFFIFSAPDCCCLFAGIDKLSINYDNLHSVINMRCERLLVRMWEWRVTFLSNWDGAPLGVSALRKLRTLRIESHGAALMYTNIYTPLQKYWNSESNSFIFAVD